MLTQGVVSLPLLARQLARHPVLVVGAFQDRTDDLPLTAALFTHALSAPRTTLGAFSCPEVVLYAGTTPTKFGQFRVSEPFHFDRMHLHEEGTQLREVSWDIPIPVLDQEDLLEQGILVSTLIKGATNVDALGSCTANASMASLAERLTADDKDITEAGLSGDAVADEKRAIIFYHDDTTQTGDPAQEYPPTDCGSTGLYCCRELIREKLISDYKTGAGAAALLSMLQTGSVIEGTPWFNSWMKPDSDGFVDGDGSFAAVAEAVESGVAGGHETCVHAIMQLAQDSRGVLDLKKTVVKVRNSWSAAFALDGDFLLHASTLQMLSQFVDYKQFVI